jgi:hypothetical protein
MFLRTVGTKSQGVSHPKGENSSITINFVYVMLTYIFNSCLLRGSCNDIQPPAITSKIINFFSFLLCRAY